jgi:uncharacterized membrane protein
MPNESINPNDALHSVERWTSRVLRLGVWVSASLMIFGLLFAAISPAPIDPLSTNPSLGMVAKHLFSSRFDPVILMFAGLLMLMFTPILRVITAVYGFAMERDWRFVVVSSVVFILLAGEIMYSILLKG